MSVRKIALAMGLSLTLLFGAGCGGGGTVSGPSAAVKKVASIDESVIYQLDDFKKADKALTEWTDKETKKRGEKVRNASNAVKDAEFQQYQMELTKKTNELIGPLKERARAAIAIAAKAKGVTVVLDKKIVVYGVPDITDDVKALLLKGDKLEYPKDEIDPKEAPIGYFDQDVVRSLKAFKEAEMEIGTERAKQIGQWQEQFQKEGRNPTQAEMQRMQQTLEVRLQALQEQKMGPLVKAVTDSVAEVAKSEKLSLVLDTQHVMHGGRNLTELVVDNFLKKVDGVTSAPDASSSPKAPQASSTPGNGG